MFRAANGGTLLLDEIGNIPLAAQYSLLRVLQEGTVRPVGAHKEVAVDVRVIAATNSPLHKDVEQNTFREDLLYRLDVMRINIPPLRERPEDIIFLFARFMRELSEHYNIERPDVSDRFLDALQNYEWPGNVRELENFAERALLTHRNTRLTDDFFSALVGPNGALGTASGHQPSNTSAQTQATRYR